MFLICFYVYWSQYISVISLVQRKIFENVVGMLLFITKGCCKENIVTNDCFN